MTFAYGADEPVLRDVSFEVAAGELQRMQRRYEVGVVDRIGLTGIEAAARQYEGQLASHESRLAIRQAFLAAELTAVEAELLLREKRYVDAGASTKAVSAKLLRCTLLIHANNTLGRLIK